jgi:hypothetical protein
MTFAVQRNALVISAVAGTLLNCINQLPDVLSGQGVNIAKLVLTYLVPYCVSVTSAVLLVHKQRKQQISSIQHPE